MMELEESRIAFIGFSIGFGAGLSYARTGRIQFTASQVAEAVNGALVAADLGFIEVKREEVEHVAKMLEPLLKKVITRN